MTKSIYPVILKEKAFPFYLTGIGITDPEYHVYREKGLVSHQFLFTTDGKGILKIGGKKLILKSGDFLYLPPSIPHEYYPENSDWKTCWCVFRGNHIDSLMEDLGFSEYIIKNVKNLSEIKQFFNRILNIAEISNNGEECSKALYEYILLIRNIFFEEENISSNPLIKKSLEYIDINYEKDITDEELAKEAGCSIQYFCRIFKKTLGLRPLEYIAKKRISEAKNLLENSSLSLTEIAANTGFGSLNYFGMVFKKYEGISASEYKIKHHI